MFRSDGQKQTSRSLPQDRNGPNEEPEGHGDEGPFNFKQFLRRTNYAPTDTIRKRQLKRDGVAGYGSEYQM